MLRLCITVEMLYVWFGVLLCWLYNKFPIKDSNDSLNLEAWFNGS